MPENNYEQSPVPRPHEFVQRRGVVEYALHLIDNAVPFLPEELKIAQSPMNAQNAQYPQQDRVAVAEPEVDASVVSFAEAQEVKSQPVYTPYYESTKPEVSANVVPLSVAQARQELSRKAQEAALPTDEIAQEIRNAA